jgi:hypothetical protein
MINRKKETTRKPYYSDTSKDKPTPIKKPYKYTYAQPTDEDEVFLQQFFWDIKDDLGGF